jgi:hypothetical protein
MPVKSKTTIYKLKPLGYAVFVLFIFFYSKFSFALPMIPMAYSGSLGYTYSYIKSEQAESENATLTADFSGSGFIWQPWFVTLGFGLSFGISDSNTNTGSSSASSTTYSGNIQFTVFPQSRFPFIMSLSRTDSRLENTSASFDTADQYVNYRLFMSQTYYGVSGYVARLSYDHNAFDSDDSDSSSDNFSASLRARKSRHRFSASANYTTSERSTSDLKPSNGILEGHHNYTPGTEFNVSSLASYTRNDTGVSDDRGLFENLQANSNFSWRPIDRPYTLNGGARISASESGAGNESNNLATNIGASYRASRALRFLAQASFSATDTNSDQSIFSTANVNANYSSQQYFVGRFNWNWNGGAGIGNSTSSVNDTTNTVQNYSVNLGQNFSRSAPIGRTSTMNFGFNQSGNVSYNSEVEDTLFGLGNGISFGWSRRGLSSGTFSSLSFNDTRAYGPIDTVFQQLLWQFTQRNALSRVSSLSASATFQATRQELTDTENPSQPMTLAANITYTNARTFGIYPLRFSSRWTYNKRFEDEQISSLETLESDNRFDYRIGLLTTSVTFRIMTTQGGSTTESLTFTIVRAF